MVDQYAENKESFLNHTENKNKNSIFFPYTKETYGTFIYQEQVQKICVEMAGLTWEKADKIMKFMKKPLSALSDEERKKKIKEAAELEKEFVSGAVKQGYDAEESKETFNKLLTYGFNKGHATGYALISIEQMYYKIYYPAEFWYVTLKYANEQDIPRLSEKAVADGCIILLPHVNGCAHHKLIKIDGDLCIREGLLTIKSVGQKAAKAIEEERKRNGKYKDYDDFVDRMEPYKRTVNSRVLSVLKEQGALEFRNKIYFARCEKYNSALYSRGLRN